MDSKAAELAGAAKTSSICFFEGAEGRMDGWMHSEWFGLFDIAFLLEGERIHRGEEDDKSLGGEGVADSRYFHGIKRKAGARRCTIAGLAIRSI